MCVGLHTMLYKDDVIRLNYVSFAPTEIWFRRTFPEFVLAFILLQYYYYIVSFTRLRNIAPVKTYLKHTARFCPSRSPRFIFEIILGGKYTNHNQTRVTRIVYR